MLRDTLLRPPTQACQPTAPSHLQQHARSRVLVLPLARHRLRRSGGSSSSGKVKSIACGGASCPLARAGRCLALGLILDWQPHGPSNP